MPPVNTVSPGITATDIARKELACPGGDAMRQILRRSAAKRIAMVDDIAAPVEFLAGPAASLITGADQRAGTAHPRAGARLWLTAARSPETPSLAVRGPVSGSSGSELVDKNGWDASGDGL
ncbi:SDR family oxidoreductase [Streptomyces luteolifulvus]|uniref:SDR family oxidoreductase n=1 Tax=Streptomyces luteolifulvus TaxID=2615112 RepID=UPI001786C7FF|nr:SDR family oxidoreductase [Streptomyces luteolifulvus]